MHYRNVCLESLAYTLPEERVSSAELERRMERLYQRLNLPEGRLELMTGIRERRFWKPGVLPSDKSIETAEKAIRAAGVQRSQIGALVHGSVCRDQLEPATACRVHHGLALPSECLVYDVSNACLGLLNGVLQVANMIELGQIRAGLVVGSEGSRQLVERTIEVLNADLSFDRRSIKRAVASLTIGSGSAAVLLVHREMSQTDNRLTVATARANSAFHELCQGGADEAAGEDRRPLMETNSEQLMQQGIATGVETFSNFLAETGWSRSDLDATYCHQVGGAHRKALLRELELPETRDFTTFQWLGNTGSVALPLTMAIGLERNKVVPGSRLGLFGIGSGINCLMLGVQWQRTLVASGQDAEAMAPPRTARFGRHKQPGKPRMTPGQR